jgi:hypothetical protein
VAVLIGQADSVKRLFLVVELDQHRNLVVSDPGVMAWLDDHYVGGGDVKCAAITVVTLCKETDVGVHTQLGAKWLQMGDPP